jgi:hypothetical protein
MKKISLFILAVFMGITATFAVFPTGVAYAADVDCNKEVIGLRPWYMGLSKKVNGSCVIDSDIAKNDLASFVWRIVLNILVDLSVVIGYIALIFVIWGGFKYIMSNGEPNKVVQAKSMLTNALIGLVIAILATVIVNTIIAVLGNAAK